MYTFVECAKIPWWSLEWFTWLLKWNSHRIIKTNTTRKRCILVRWIWIVFADFGWCLLMFLFLPVVCLCYSGNIMFVPLSRAAIFCVFFDCSFCYCIVNNVTRWVGASHGNGNVGRLVSREADYPRSPCELRAVPCALCLVPRVPQGLGAERQYPKEMYRFLWYHGDFKVQKQHQHMAK